MIDFSREFAASPIMLILRGLGVERSLDLAGRAWDAGVGFVEVPVQSDADAETLRALVAAGDDRGKSVGAGTITSVALVDRVAEAGAVFTVAPGLDAEVARASIAAGMSHLPGVGTGSEIQAALSLGCDWVKVFPAAPLGAPWVRAMRGPFPRVGMVATGGMSSANAEEFFGAGIDAIAVGAALGDPGELAALMALAANPPR
jgi:2-dehydro-3-deoxyphosphogluconate aldolase/(4S)-4-hydroxy-2-oxoglutarate aldolase